jgi:predicted permease
MAVTGMLTRWLTDLRMAWRGVRRTPSAAAVVVLLLALGFGGSIAMFGLIEKVLLKPLPVAHADRLMRFSAVDAKGNHQLLPLTWLDELERRSTAFDAMAGHTGPMTLVAELPRGTAGVGVESVTGDFFAMLDIAPHRGRLFTEADDLQQTGAAPLPVVLGYQFWRREFADDPSILGRQFRLDGAVATVIGVTPDTFHGLIVELASDIFVPQRAYAAVSGLGNPRLGPRTNYVIARRRTEASSETAAANLRVAWTHVREQMIPPAATAQEREGLRTLDVSATSFRTGTSSLRTSYADPLRALGWLMAVLLLLATVNLAGLLVARGLARRRELQVRLALGASRHDLRRQFAAEATVLAALGIAAALPLAYWTSRGLVSTLWSGVTAPDLSLVPGPLTLVALLVSGVLVVVTLGGIPVLVATRGLMGNPTQTRGVTGAVRRATQVLMVAQVSLSVALVFAAALFAGNLQQWRRVDPGFTTEGVTIVNLSQQPNGYRGLVPGPYYRAMIDRLRALPGVEHAGLTHSWARYSRALLRKEDVFAPGSASPVMQALSDRATPGFFDSIGVPLLRGRDFSWTDEPGRLPVAIVSERVARAITSGGDVLGTRIRIGTGPSELEIVGVVADFRPTDIRVADAGFVYQSIGQQPTATSLPVITLRASRPVDADLLRRAVSADGREYALAISALADRVDRQLVRERVTAGLGTSVAALALLIVATGLGSLLAFLVSGRLREFGVRLALGATPQSLWMSVVRSSVVLAGAGVAVGIPLAMAAGRTVSAVLIGVSPTDTLSLAAAGAVVILTAVVAGIQPARRASRTDPLATLRSE